MAKATARNVIRFLVAEVFHKFGVPEILVSDNGCQFLSKEFQDMFPTFGIHHMRTAVYSPQANASERVNQSILAAIRSYLKEDQREWDNHLSKIECALRSSVHTSTGVTPYFALFGSNMITHGSVYKLARQLEALEENDLKVLAKPTKLEVVRRKIQENLAKSYDIRARIYNKRAWEVKFRSGQVVFRRNYRQSGLVNCTTLSWVGSF